MLIYPSMRGSGRGRFAYLYRRFSWRCTGWGRSSIDIQEELGLARVYFFPRDEHIMQRYLNNGLIQRQCHGEEVEEGRQPQNGSQACRGRQRYEVDYESRKTGKSRKAVKKAVTNVGSSRKKVRKALSR